ncbi:MAG: tRNA 2-thiouridine(34) synthase MnmA [Bacilli bacterium]|nr:tRNA 2-thiouridine(34) synthase MnmA [Bacilli bacterium]
MKVMIGLSGGVDSAVAAYLLKEQGYEVIACFMRNWDAMANNDYLGNPTINDNQCPQEKDYQDAQKVADQLGIPLLRIDFIKEYWDHVFSYFIEEYEKGRTPNPDILCNKYIKFDAFREFAKKNGCEKIAMGHYAKKKFVNGHWYLEKCYDQNKDQTYFLSQINEEQIESCLFPLGDIDKTKVREIAHKLNLVIADKKDSTGVCFIGERNFREFLKNYIPAQKGKIIDIDSGKVIGDHKGVYYYTIGQHKGLGIGGISGETASGWFIVKKDAKNNILYVTRGDTQKYLLSNKCIVRKLNIINPNEQFPQNVGVKFRYRQKDHPATIDLKDGEIVCVYSDYKAVTPGQEAVFYNKDGLLIASGTIDEVYKDDKRIDI